MQLDHENHKYAPVVAITAPAYENKSSALNPRTAAQASQRYFSRRQDNDCDRGLNHDSQLDHGQPLHDAEGPTIVAWRPVVFIDVGDHAHRDGASGESEQPDHPWNPPTYVTRARHDRRVCAVQPDDTEYATTSGIQNDQGSKANATAEPAIASIIRLSVKCFEGRNDELTSECVATAVPGVWLFCESKYPVRALPTPTFSRAGMFGPTIMIHTSPKRE